MLNPPEANVQVRPWFNRVGSSRTSNPPAWNSGPWVSDTVDGSIFHFTAWTEPIHSSFPWESTAPFCRPVVPEVYINVAGSSIDISG